MFPKHGLSPYSIRCAWQRESPQQGCVIFRRRQHFANHTHTRGCRFFESTTCIAKKEKDYSPPPPTDSQHSNTGIAATLENVVSSSGERVTWLSVWSNLGLAGGKAAAGAFTGSVSLIADAAHSLSDLGSDAVTLFALHLGQRRADRSHPYGYGKQLGYAIRPYK
jgi:hypothetical protein